MQHPRSSRSFRAAAAASAIAALLAASCARPCAGENAAHESDHATSQRSFADVEKWTKVFDDPERDTWQKPAALVDALGLRQGMTVAEIGAGTGYLMRYLVAAVGDSGSVLLADIEPALVAHLRERAEEQGAGNVVPILASKNAPRLPRGAADVVLFLDSYHHIGDRVAYMQALRRDLKPNGRVAVVDWHKQDLPKGPPLDHKIDRHQVVDEMRAAGYAFAGSPLDLPYHYVLVFAPSETR